MISIRPSTTYAQDKGLHIVINSEDDVDESLYSEEYVEYVQFDTGSFVSFFDDAGEEVTYAADDIEQLIEALEVIRIHHVLYGDGGPA